MVVFARRCVADVGRLCSSQDMGDRLSALSMRDSIVCGDESSWYQEEHVVHGEAVEMCNGSRRGVKHLTRQIKA